MSTRAAAFGGDVLSPINDNDLDRIVHEAADALDAPIALVSLVLMHTQYFRAHVGLPPDLMAVPATDVNLSFCQFAVREKGVFEVNHAATDPRVPQALVETFGIQAYLGAPLFVGDDILGTLCILDNQPREFSAEERRQLESLAKEASRRLKALARHRVASQVDAQAFRPSFLEMRNLLTPLMVNASELRVFGHELMTWLAAIERGDRVASVMPATLEMSSDLAAMTQEIDDVAHQLCDMTLALERALVGSEMTAKEFVEKVDLLAKHATQTVGGVVWQGDAGSGRIMAAPAVFRAVAGALTTWTGAVEQGPLVVRVVNRSEEVTFRFVAPTSARNPMLQVMAAALTSVEGPKLLQVEDGLVLSLPIW